MRRIYLDYCATTPLSAEALDAMNHCFRQGQALANPASQHSPGRTARRALEDAREAIAWLAGAKLAAPHADRVLLTSGGTEANNLAILGLAGRRGGHLIISSIEHPSVAGPAAWLEGQGWRISRLGVSSRGEVLVDELPEMLQGDTRLVSVMLGNNETGVLQPIERLAALCAKAGVPLHTDAVQAAGKLPLDFHRRGVSLMTISAHKFHGPVGAGALIVRQSIELQPLFHGGPQQLGLRPGTESVALAVGMHAALAAAERDAGLVRRLAAVRDQFEQELRANCPEVVVNGAGAARLPQTSNVAFPGLDRQNLLIALDLAGIACSTGSACSSGSSEPSRTLRAMGLPKSLYEGSLRFSFGPETSSADCTEAVRRIIQVYNDLRSQNQRRKIVPDGSQAQQ